MRRIKLIMLLIPLISVSNIKAQITELLWANQIGSASSDQINGITNDADNNIYTIGTFSATVDFDPGLDEVLLTSDVNRDFFIQKNDPEGNLIWVKQLSGIAYGSTGINIDGDGNIFVMGYFGDSLDVNPAEDETYYIYQEGDDFASFILKLSPEGEFTWVKEFTSSEAAIVLSSIEDVQFDNDGNILGLLILQGTINVGSEVEPIEISAEQNDVVIFKLNTVDGELDWFKQIGGTGREYANLVLDDDSNIFLAGHFQSTVDFDPGIGVYNLTTSLDIPSISEGFIAKYNSEGEFIWVKQVEGEYDMTVYDLSLNNESIYITGVYYGTADLDVSADLLEFESEDHYNGFVLSLDLDGNFDWAKEIVTDSGHQGIYVESDATNQLYITGSFNNSADLDPSEATFIVEGLGPDLPGPSPSNDVYITKWNPEGEILWGGHFASSDYAGYFGLHVINPNEVYGVGNFTDTLDINPILAETEWFYSEGNNDMVLFKLNIQDAVGLEERDELLGFSLYPNPSHDFVTIAVSESLNDYTISLYNILGENVAKQVKLNAFNSQIWVGDLSRGIYTVIISTESNRLTHSQKLIVD